MTTRQKSTLAFRTIGEVAAELGLPQHVLRFWESKFNQIKPHKRRGGHRYYRPMDVELLKEIKTLLHDKGYTIKGAQKHMAVMVKEKFSQNQMAMFDVKPAATAVVTPQMVQKPRTQGASATGYDTKKLENLLDGLHEIRDLLRESLDP